MGIDTEPVLATVPIFGDEFNIERRRLLCAFTVQQEKLRINALAKSKTIAYEIGEKIHAFEQVRLARCIIAIDDGNGGKIRLHAPPALLVCRADLCGAW